VRRVRALAPVCITNPDKENRKNYVMTKSTPTLTLTQSGPLAVLLQRQLLQRQRDAVIQLDRHAHRKHMRAAFWKTLTWPFRALTARTLVDYVGRRQQIHNDLRIRNPDQLCTAEQSSEALLPKSMAEGTSEALGGCRAHRDPGRLHWRRTSIRQASQKLWAAA
jgi:hypothetical protein